MSNKKKLPNLGVKVWNLSKAVAKYAVYGFKTVSLATYKERLDECDKCEHRVKDSGVCGLCGCDTVLKAEWSTEQCPDNPPKWKATI
tara:strand:- start:2138 stop:2398 length:261 start_codon:yes stop_codon:yes gene_type:complete